jgi:hypothetical protein
MKPMVKKFVTALTTALVYAFMVIFLGWGAQPAGY